MDNNVYVFIPVGQTLTNTCSSFPNKQNLPLSSEGIKQIQNVESWNTFWHQFCRIITSPQLCAQQTALILARKAKITYSKENLIEFTEYPENIYNHCPRLVQINSDSRLIEPTILESPETITKTEYKKLNIPRIVLSPGEYLNPKTQALTLVKELEQTYNQRYLIVSHLGVLKEIINNFETKPRFLTKILHTPLLSGTPFGYRETIHGIEQILF